MNGSFLMSVKPAFLKSTVSHPTSSQASVKMVARLPPSYSACAYRCDWRQNDMASLTLLPTAEHICVTSPKLTCYSEGNSQVYYAAPVGKGYKKPGAKTKKQKNPNRQNWDCFISHFTNLWEGTGVRSWLPLWNPSGADNFFNQFL